MTLKYEKGSFCVVPIMMLKGLNPYSQLLFVWLCHHANQSGECFPSLSLLTSECNFSKPTLIKAINELIHRGYLIKEIRTKKDSKEKTSNFYRLTIKNTDNLSGEVVNVADHVVNDVDYPVVNVADHVVNDVDRNYNKITISTPLTIKKINTSMSTDEIRRPVDKKIPYVEILKQFEDILGDDLRIPIKGVKAGSTREKHIKARWKTELPTLQDWINFFKMIKRSNFLCGKVISKDGKRFEATFDWIIKESNCIKILEGTYVNRS